MANAINHGLSDTPNQLKIAFKMPPKPPSPILTQVQALVDSIAQMKEAYEADKNESERHDKVLYEKIKLLTLANKDLNTHVASLEGILYEMKLDDRDALLDPSLRGVGTGNVSGGNEENNVGGNTHREALEKAERSAEAAESNVIKVSKRTG